MKHAQNRNFWRMSWKLNRLNYFLKLFINETHIENVFLHPNGLSCVYPTLESIILKSPFIGSGNFTSSTTQKLSIYSFLYVHLCLETTYFCHSQVWTLHNIVYGKTLLRLSICKMEKAPENLRRLHTMQGFFEKVINGLPLL